MSFRILSIYLLLIFSETLFGQKNDDASHGISLLGARSSFDNVVINNQPDQDQRNVTICSSVNGWLFAAYTHIQNNVEWVTILKSVDSGHSWEIISDVSSDTPSWRFKKLQVISCGLDTNNLKLLFGMSIYVTGGGFYLGVVDRFDVNTASWEGDILEDYSREIYDIAIASDDLFPASGSNPGSIAAIYFKRYQHDSIYFCVSDNGGQSFTTRRNIAGTNKRLGKVSLTYGRSSSFPNGRYFAAWEEKETDNSLFGHIYTAHSEPNFNSSFTNPICIDLSDSSLNNKVRYPVISSQASNFDNDSSDLTTLITCEHYVNSSQNLNINGFYNKKSVSGTGFHSFACSTDQHNKLTPDVAFNPYDSTFMITYFDSTDLKLPYAINSVNMISPDTWNYFSTGYNIDLNLSKPAPSIRIDHSKNSGMVCWVGERSNGNGKAMFSTPLLFPVGIHDNQVNSFAIKTYPNPASNVFNLELKLSISQVVNVSLYNEIGSEVFVNKEVLCKPEKNLIMVDVSSLHPGLYIFKISCQEGFTTGKVIVK